MTFRHILTLSAAIFTCSVLPMRASMSLQAAEGHGHGHEGEHNDAHGHEEEAHEEGIVKLTDEQMTAAGVSVVSVQKGTLSGQISVPGRIVPDANRMAQIVPRISGIVTEAHKNIGDLVKKGDVLARIESREMAESVAQYQAASRSAGLARANYAREKKLWEKQVTAEQDYLIAKNTWQEAQIALDLSKQKLQALGYEANTSAPSRFYELKSPIDGRVIARELTLGEFVDMTHQAFTVADLSVLWVEVSVSPADLPVLEEGQQAMIEGGAKQGQGKLVFISPAIDPATRTAKAIIEMQNGEGGWRSGDFATASIMTGAQGNGLFVPKVSVQTIEGKTSVFIKTAQGFEKREVVTGQTNERLIEIISGLSAGEEIASGNTFVLKAEAGKSEAEHSH